MLPTNPKCCTRIQLLLCLGLQPGPPHYPVLKIDLKIDKLLSALQAVKSLVSLHACVARLSGLQLNAAFNFGACLMTPAAYPCVDIEAKVELYRITVTVEVTVDSEPQSSAAD